MLGPPGLSIWNRRSRSSPDILEKSASSGSVAELAGATVAMVFGTEEGASGDGGGGPVFGGLVGTFGDVGGAADIVSL